MIPPHLPHCSPCTHASKSIVLNVDLKMLEGDSVFYGENPDCPPDEKYKSLEGRELRATDGKSLATVLPAKEDCFTIKVPTVFSLNM